MRWLLPFIMLLVQGCQPTNQDEPVTLVIGSWYGFYPFYYAAEKGLDKQHGLRMKIVEPPNVSNFRRSYLRDQVDIAATSMLEFTNAYTMSQLAIKPIIISDYSNGGDVIIATKQILSTQQLHDKRIAVPSKGIGEYILSLVFNDQNPGVNYTQLKIPETECERAFLAQKIDACVTYPPISTHLLKNPELHQIYNTKAHPERVFDIIWAKPHLSEQTVKKVQSTWFSTIDAIEEDPQAYYQFVARIANVTASSVEESMRGIKLINRVEHQRLMDSSEKLATDLVRACQVAVGENCQVFQFAFEGQY